MLKFGEFGDLTVVSFDAAAIRGGVFGMRSGRRHLLRTAEKKYKYLEYFLLIIQPKYSNQNFQ